MKPKILLCVPALALGLSLPLALSPTAEGTAAPARAETFRVDTGHSSVIYRVQHLGVSNFYGTFKDVSGTVVLDEDKPSDSSVEIAIDAASVDSRSEQRDGHLTSPDFFSAKEFPEITFESTKVKKGKEKGHFEVTGDMTVRGVTKSMTVDVELTGKDSTRMGYRAGFEAEFVLHMPDYKMPAMEKMDASMLGRDVHVIVAIEAIRE